MENLQAFTRVQESSRSVALLKACAKQKDLHKGMRVHAGILEKGLLERNCYVANTLVNMYAKCGALAKAAQVLHELPVRDVVSWNTLISGYAQQRQGKEALKCFELMQSEGLFPNAVTFTCILKACGNIRALKKGSQIHEEILRQGLLVKDVALGNAVVDMYCKCGALPKAAQVLEELPIRDVVTWSALISGYAQEGQGEPALKCFDRMRSEGISPNMVTFICILKACGSIRAADKGEEIHKEIQRQGGFGKDVVLGTTLVDMYAKCGALAKAAQVLDELPVQDVVTWNALIDGCAQEGQGEEALKCFMQMQNEGFSPNKVTFLSILKACSSIRAADKGEQIHSEIVSQGLLGNENVLGNTLVDMYAKCGALTKAARVLDELPVRDIVAWSALIAGYSQHEQGEEALKCFERLQREGLSPDAVTYICLLRACGSIRATDKGEQMHDEIVRQGLLGKEVVLGNTLVDMYTKCGALSKAAQVLKELPVWDVVSWSVLIAGYVHHGQGEEALKCFDQMQREGLSPNAVTFASVLKACGNIGAVARGEQIHDEIVQLGLFGKDTVLGNTLVDMYAKCGVLSKAARVLDELPVKDVVSWSALIAGYVHQEQGEEALKCFERMKREGLLPDLVTYICILKACGSIGAAEKGEQIHDEIVRQGFWGKDVVLGTTLVDMYAKCGALAKAAQVLGQLPVRDAVSWSALITGYAQQGQGEKALKCFKEMQSEGLSPDTVTVAIVLSACCRSGLLDEGQVYYANMSTHYGITPNVEHHTCMIDLFGRAGEFDKALTMIKKMPSSHHLTVWHALLDACREFGNAELGSLAFYTAVQIDTSDAAAYVLMSKLCAAARG